MKSTVQIKLKGHRKAYRDAVVTLRHEATGKEVERKPFLDGSLTIRGLMPGYYEVVVGHPNLTLPLEKRRVRVFDQRRPTVVSIPVPADLFEESEIAETPDADLSPVQQLATDVQERLGPISHKDAGEVIRAADWETLVGAVADLAKGLAQLTTLVSPTGHDHPEIADKIGVVEGNLRAFAEAYGKSLLELRREIEIAQLEQNIGEVLDAAGADNETRARIWKRLHELTADLQASTPQFSRRLANIARMLLAEINDLADKQGTNADDFLGRDDVMRLTKVAEEYARAGRMIDSSEELKAYLRTTTQGGSKLGRATKSGRS